MARVRVVDDEEMIVRMVSKAREARDHTVLPAHDGITALAIARTEQPDLILSDVMMPRMDGFALCKALHVDDATCAIPLILMSAASDLRDPDCAAVAYVPKPLRLATFSALIATHVGENH